MRIAFADNGVVKVGEFFKVCVSLSKYTFMSENQKSFFYSGNYIFDNVYKIENHEGYLTVYSTIELNEDQKRIIRNVWDLFEYRDSVYFNSLS